MDGRGLELRSSAGVRVAALEPRWRAGEVQILDVRERDEWDEFRIPGSVNVPYHELTMGLGGLDPTRPIACICSGGVRSGIAVGLLQREGLDPLHVLDGVGVWQQQGFPIEPGAEAA